MELIPRCGDPAWLLPQRSSSPRGLSSWEQACGKRETSSHQFHRNQGGKPHSQTPWSIRVRGALPIDPAMDTRRQWGVGTPETWVPLSDLRTAGKDASV